MDEKEILQRQVDALEKLLQIKEAIIQEQESRIQKLENEAIVAKFPQFPQQPYQPLQPLTPPPFISIPSVWQHDPCPKDGGYHEYPSPWFSTSPAPCSKCGKQAPSTGVTFTSSDGTQTPL